MNYPRLALAAIAALIVFFAWGFLTEGWLLQNDFAPSAALYRPSDVQMKYMPFGLVSVLIGLLAAVVQYAGWCGPRSGTRRGLQFGIIMGVFVACIHSISNLITMNMDTNMMPNATSFICPNGSHMWDDQQAYFRALIPFLKSL